MSEKLKELMKFSIMVGQLSEAHEESLKKYPFIFLDGIDQAEISYQIPTMGETEKSVKVVYTLKFKEEFPKDDMKEGMANIRKAINVLFQHNVEVTFFSLQGKELG